MDALRAEMEAQKARTAALKEAAGAGKRKFVRRGDIAAVEAYQAEERRQAVDAKLAERAAAERSTNGAVELTQILTKKPRRASDDNGNGAAPSPRAAAAAALAHAENGGAGTENAASMKAPLPVDEVVVRLRAMGQPVTFFGETEMERYLRMRKCEEEGVDDDFAISKGHGGELRNVFLDKHTDDVDSEDDDDDDDDDNGDDEGPKKKSSKRKAAGSAAESSSSSSSGAWSSSAASAAAPAKPLTEEQKAAKKLKEEHTRVKDYFKGLLRAWEAQLNARPDHVKRTAQGKIETKTQKQCKDYIRPLYKLCKRREVPADILSSLLVMIQ